MTMNDDMKTCEAYREAIAQDPSCDSGEAHLAECASCRAFQSEMQALDRRIQRALALPVPELSTPVLPSLDTGKVATLSKRRSRAPAWFAMAATVAVAAVLGFRMLNNEINSQSLADQIIAHIDHEPYALRVTDKAVSDARLARVLPANVSTLDHSAGLITYAQSCIINGNNVPHLVIQGLRGPITILLMPQEKVSGRQSITGKSVNGVIWPFGDGSIAIVGEGGEPLEQIEEKVRNSVTWST